MARHIMKNAVVKHGSNVIDGVKSFEVEESVSEVDLTAAGDAWASHDTGIPSWTASLSLILDHDAAANQTLRAGDVLTFEGYTEGSASGKTYFAGTASVLTHKGGGSYDGEATREYSLKGNGALAISVAA